jgi:type I restriction enzyme R subunit
VPSSAPPETIIQVEGFDVHITDGGKFVVTQIDGRATPVTVEEYRERIAAKLVEGAPTLDYFRTHWLTPPKRSELLSHLPEQGRSANIIRQLNEMNDYDLYDVLGEIGYGLDPRTRVDRAQAFDYKHEVWLSALPRKTASTLKALVAQFANDGTDALESREIFKVPDVVKAGGLDALNALGKKPTEILREAKERIFEP